MMEIRNEQGVLLLTPNEASERLNLTPHQVRWLIRNHRIEGVVKRGRDFFIPETSLKNVVYLKTGRPRKVPTTWDNPYASGVSIPYVDADKAHLTKDTERSQHESSNRDEEGNEEG
jgi:Helix-turn-helix domain